jgi:prepilin-type N-terminal cleavage/methylation domain-containing protein
MINGGFLRRYPTSRRERGFTLVELAVVVLVVGLLIGSLLVPLSTQVDQRNAAEAQRRLEDAREALLGFAVTNDRFPCPATSTSNGQESFCTANLPAACGAEVLIPPSHGRCFKFGGFLPGQTLGLNNLDSSGYALDGYPQSLSGPGRIRYAIADAPLGGTAHILTTSSAMRTAGIGTIGSTTYLYVCASAPVPTTNTTTCGTSATLANGNAVFIVYSLGKNGTIDASADETWNINNSAGLVRSNFVSRTYSSVQNQTFDDQLLWISNYALISRMIAAGKLP